MLCRVDIMDNNKRLTREQEELFNKNKGLAIAAVRNIYTNKFTYISKEDLIQMAYLYLMEAAMEYSKEGATVAFSTYAINKIRYGIMGSLKKELIHNADAYHGKQENLIGSEDRKTKAPLHSLDNLPDKSICVDMAAGVSESEIRDIFKTVDSKNKTFKKAGEMFRYYLLGHTLSQTGEQFGCSTAYAHRQISKYRKEAKAVAVASGLYYSG